MVRRQGRGIELLAINRISILFIYRRPLLLLLPPGVDYMHPDLKFNYVSGYFVGALWCLKAGGE